MLDLYFAPTANGRRAAIILEESGLPYNLHLVSLAQKSTELLKRNPGGFIPVLEDSDGPNHKPIVLAQSGAILLYVAEKVGRFIPADPARRAIAMQCLMFACSDIAGTSSAILAAGDDVPEPSKNNVRFFEERMLGYFRMAENYLRAREFLAEEISVADFALYTFFVRRKRLVDDAGDLSNLTRWGTTMAARPAVIRAMELKGA